MFCFFTQSLAVGSENSHDVPCTECRSVIQVIYVQQHFSETEQNSSFIFEWISLTLTFSIVILFSSFLCWWLIINLLTCLKLVIFFMCFNACLSDGIVVQILNLSLLLDIKCIIVVCVLWRRHHNQTLVYV
jgi:hypothetical protein